MAWVANTAWGCVATLVGVVRVKRVCAACTIKAAAQDSYGPCTRKAAAPEPEHGVSDCISTATAPKPHPHPCTAALPTLRAAATLVLASCWQLRDHTCAYRWVRGIQEAVACPHAIQVSDWQVAHGFLRGGGGGQYRSATGT